MLVHKIAGVLGVGTLVAVAVACGGGVPDSTQDVQGAATRGNPTSAPAKAGDAPAGTAKATPPASTSGSTVDGKPATTDPTNTRTPPSAQGTPNGDDDDDTGTGGTNGAPGRISVDQHCCFAGKYLHCPDASACLGGFDVNACMATCTTDVQCIEECVSKLDSAGAPVGCDANAAPPPGVDCANGTIDVRK